MAHNNDTSTCDDCKKILAGAGSLLSARSSTKEVFTIPFDEPYHSRLVHRVSTRECSMCLLISSTIPSLMERLEPSCTERLEVSVSEDHPSSAFLKHYRRYHENNQDIPYLGEMHIQEGSQATHTCTLNCSSTWSSQTMNQIRDWLQTCSSTHLECNRPYLPYRLPRRLLDVWCSSKPMPRDFDRLSLDISANVRIVSSDSLAPETKYLTLSHRWGDPPSLILNSSTAPQLLLSEDISLHLLNCREAAAFRHAIHVTRGLGYRYLWIDALCIMQDDMAQKTTDIMWMDEVYTNSALNISASEANVEKGLVFERDPTSINPLRETVLVGNTDSQESLTLQISAIDKNLLYCNAPLYQRGWVYQERSLSPRIVHFTETQVLWECHHLEASEVLPLGYQAGDKASIRSELTLDAHPLSMDRWLTNVEFYSATSLTYPNDRLLAISALAKKFCSRTQLDPADYLAGMWKGELPLSLLWEQTDTEQTATEIVTETNVAPSWSWASIVAPIECPRSTSEWCVKEATAEVLDVEINRVSQNLLDGTSLCRLRIRGYMCGFQRLYDGQKPWVWISDKTRFRETGSFELSDYEDWKIRGRIRIAWDVGRTEVADVVRDTSDGLHPGTYFFLHIATEWPSDGEKTHGSVSGIVLRRTSTYATYERIGYFHVPYSDEYATSELADAFSGGLDALDEAREEYLERSDDGRYVSCRKASHIGQPSRGETPPPGQHFLRKKRSRSRSPSLLKAPPRPAPRRAIRPLLFLVALVHLSWSLYQLPVTRVIESRLCHDHYLISDPSKISGDGTVPEELCKLDTIQQRLGKMQGVMETMWVGCDFLMTIPLVTLADRYGYGFVLTLNLIPRAFLLGWTLVVGYMGQGLGLPVEWVVLAPAGSWLGGGCVFDSVVYYLVSESTDDVVLRATFFAYLNATTSIFSSQLGPALASLTMSLRLWLPFTLGLLLLFLASLLIPLIPIHPIQTPLPDPESTATPPPPPKTLLSLLTTRLTSITSLLTSPSPNFLLLLLVFFLASFASSDTKLLPLYISKRYHLLLSQIGYLLSLKAVFNFFLLTYIVPTLLRRQQARVITSAHELPEAGNPTRTTIYNAKICLLISAFGALCILLAPTFAWLVVSLGVYALGIALPMFTFGLLKSDHFVKQGGNDTDTGVVFSVVMLVRTVGTLLGAMLMPLMWVTALKTGKEGDLGLPWGVSGIVYAAASVILLGMRVPG
ncbi:heterokaryon incompatibility protein-domain-containing protein [Triangularia verruculosa]|uniref:Heterokaryon incompatibility protein-domain-containing protein n=1 Tax=Triangularia verruculosa TaxID=2587418 RepID=A0AAN7AZR6_9PEZI|nr:heterokaryon incompatibility protein-domain-containing protein [Triangularia verruculosa]